MGVEHRFNLFAHLPPDVADMTVLNLGAGYCASPISVQFTSLICRKLTNVEIWPQYFETLSRLRFTSAAINIREDIVPWVLATDDKSYDVVVLLDVLEHQPKDVALRLLNEFKRIARKFVVIFLPIGVCPQDAQDMNPWQRHLSVWDTKDFEDGWGVEFYKGYHVHLNPPVDAAWCTYVVTGASE